MKDMWGMKKRYVMQENNLIVEKCGATSGGKPPEALVAT